MKAFKLVKADEVSGYWSFLVEGKACVKYRVGVWASAPTWLAEKGYHLFILPDLKAVNDAVRGFSLTAKIFECEIEEIMSLPQKLDMVALSAGNMVENPGDWPDDTIMVKRIKLIKEISR